MVAPTRKLIDYLPTIEVHDRETNDMCLRAIVDAYGPNTVLLDESGTVLHVNRKWHHFAVQQHLFGQSYGPGFNYFRTANDPGDSDPERTAVIKTCIKRLLAGDKSETSVKFTLQSGIEEKVYKMRAARIDLGDSRRGFRILVTHEETLTKNEPERHNEERLYRLLETTNVMPWEADFNSFEFTYVGGQAVKILGYPLSQWTIPGFWTSHIHPEDRELAVSTCRRLSESLDHFDFEYRMIAADGRVVWIHDLVSILRERDRPTTLHGFMIDITERKRTEEALRDLGGRLITAQEEERRRVARELHDDLSQRLAILSIELDQLRQKVPKGRQELEKSIRRLSSRAQDISTEVHRLSYQLHPAKLDHFGLAATVKSLCNELAEHHGININFHDRGIPEDLGKEEKLCLFRIIQESLNNVINHSEAREASVVLESTKGEVILRVSDNGRGFDETAQMNGLGFISMRERLRLVGGTMTIRSQPQIGTDITVSIPVVAKRMANKDSQTNPGDDERG
jgi:PAS domain S-box-containing protein